MSDKEKELVRVLGKVIDLGLADMILDDTLYFIVTYYVNTFKSNEEADFKETMDKISKLVKKKKLAYTEISTAYFLRYACKKISLAFKQCGLDGLLALKDTGEFSRGSYSYDKALNVAIKHNIMLKGTLQNKINNLKLNCSEGADRNEKDRQKGNCL